MLTKSLKSGFTLWAISYGTWPLGWIAEADYSQEEMAIDIITYAIESGIKYFDTAELYGCGLSEVFLGKALKKLNYPDVHIASKVRWSNASYTAIKKACENSLKRIGIDTLDLYYIHWRDQQFDLKECMRAMEELVDEWKIKHIGVSNFSTKTLKEAQSYCKYPIVANQVHYNMIMREPESDGLLEYCQNNDIMLVAYRPLELWKLAKNPTVHYMWLVKKYQASSVQIALNWLIGQKNVVTIFHSINKKHIDENLWSLQWDMHLQDIEYLRENLKWQIYTSDCIALK